MISAQRRQDRAAPSRPQIPGDGPGRLGDRAYQLPPRGRRQQPFHVTNHADRTRHDAVTAKNGRRDAVERSAGAVL